MDARSDTYSLGIMLFELLSGRTPFAGEWGELIGAHLYMRPPQLAGLAPDAPSALVTLIERMMSKDRAERPTMTEVRAELARLRPGDFHSGRVHESAADP